MSGSFRVERLGSLVLIHQRGRFDGALMDRLIAATEAATHEAVREHGRCSHLADVRELERSTLFAKLRLERMFRRLDSEIDRISIVADLKSTIIRAIRRFKLIVPGGQRAVLVGTIEEGLASLHRPVDEAALVTALLSPAA
jgi:hypothetical protein